MKSNDRPGTPSEHLPTKGFRCPACAEVISSAAIKCRFCHEILDQDKYDRLRKGQTTGHPADDVGARPPVLPEKTGDVEPVPVQPMSRAAPELDEPETDPSSQRRYTLLPKIVMVVVCLGGIAAVVSAFLWEPDQPDDRVAGITETAETTNKALFQTFHRCRMGDEALAQYQVSGKGAAYYNDGKVKAIHSTEQLFEHLKKPERWFILVPSHQLAPIDKEARQRKITYYVLDDRSSQFLLLSNKLGQRECTKDRNPLRKYVLSTEPKPGKLIRDKEGKVIKPNFENRVQLLGYDVKDVVRRGGKFNLKLYFKVLGSMPSQYKIFVHFDQPASRFHGDHKPLGGKFPTEYWMPGDYIVDPHDVEIPMITTPSGTYTMYMGFWLGSTRLKLTDPNHHDGVNRVNLGRVRVK